MTREEAKKELSKMIFELGFEDNVDDKVYALNMAIKALSQEPTEKPMTTDEMEREYEKSKALFHKIVECDDAISREDAIKALQKVACYSAAIKARMIGAIEDLPPVTQKSGEWIKHPEIETSAPEYLMFYECSECGDKQCFCKSDIHKKRFCNNCGAKMFEPQEGVNE